MKYMLSSFYLFCQIKETGECGILWIWTAEYLLLRQSVCGKDIREGNTMRTVWLLVQNHGAKLFSKRQGIRRNRTKLTDKGGVKNLDFVELRIIKATEQGNKN